MNGNFLNCAARRRRHAWLAAVLSIAAVAPAAAHAPAAPAADADTPTEETLAEQAHADGVLIGFAALCEVPIDELNTLMDKRIKAVGKIADAQVKTYTPEKYRSDFDEGVETARVFSLGVTKGSPDYARNCAEVRDKVRAEIAR